MTNGFKLPIRLPGVQLSKMLDALVAVLCIICKKRCSEAAAMGGGMLGAVVVSGCYIFWLLKFAVVAGMATLFCNRVRRLDVSDVVLEF